MFKELFQASKQPLKKTNLSEFKICGIHYTGSLMWMALFLDSKFCNIHTSTFVCAI